MKKTLYLLLTLLTLNSFAQQTKVTIRAKTGELGNKANFQFANSYFDDGVIGFPASSVVAQRIGDVIYGLINDYNNQTSTYTKVTTYADGTPMTDSRIDGYIYRKKGSEYFKLNYDIYSVRLFGAVGDGVHDDRQAIINAMRFVPRNLDNGTSTPDALVYLPRGIYRCSDSIRVRRTTHFYGDGSYLSSGTQIKFDSGHHGFELMQSNTHGYDTSGVLITYDGARGAGGTIFENMSITTIGGGTRPGIGIWSHCEFELQNVAVVGWPSMGVFVVGNAAPTANKDKLKIIYVTNGGTTFYTSAPDVTLIPGPGGGSGGAAHSILGGQCGHISVTDSGAGYVDNPLVKIQEVGAYSESNIKTRGYGARAIAIMGLNTASVTAGGSAYTSATVTITGSTGAYVSDPAEVEAVVESGHITAINVLNGGSGYDAGTGTNVIITDPTGSGATATATVVAGVITAVTIVDQGDNYTSTSVNIDITGNSLVRPNAHATATVSGGAVTAITVTYAGTGYANLDSVHIAITGDGSGATASAVDLKVVRVLLNSRGRDYENTAIPHVYFIGGRRNSGHNAAGSVDSLLNFRVKRVVIDASGTNYFTPPIVAFTGGGGTGARAMAMRWANENGNANRWKIRDCRLDNNAGYGLYVTGSDVNAGGVYGCDFSTNGEYGLIDNSFLGNLYMGLHSNGNGLGPYASYQNTAVNKFIMCYAEGNQMPIPALSPASFEGGDIGVQIIGGAYRTSGTQDPLTLSGTGSGLVSSVTATLLDGGNIVQYRNSSMEIGSAMQWHFDTATDQRMDFYDDGTNDRVWAIQGPYTDATFGRSETVPYSMYIDRLFLGAAKSAGKNLTMRGEFPPVLKQHQTVWAKGDIAINTTPETTGDTLTLGWERLTNGSGNVWGTDWRALTVASLSTSYALTTRANTYTAGKKQTFAANATTAGVGFGGVTANPSSLSSGDVWYRSDEGKLRYYDGSTARAFVSEQLAQVLLNKDLTSTTNTFPALTGDVTKPSGSNVTTIATGAVTNADLAGSIAYSKLSLTGAILNADLAGSIAYSKLSLTGAILNADLAGSIAYSKLSLTGAILNADLAGSIDATKINTGVVSNTEFNYLDGVTSAIQTQLDTKYSGQLSINTQSASYTLVLGDANTVVRMNVASANNLTVPPNSSVAFPVGTQIVISQVGAGQTTIVAGAGVTLNSAGAMLKTRAQYSAVTLIKTVSTDTWAVMGDLSN